MEKNELVYYVWAEYALNVLPSELAHLLDTPRVQSVAAKARCNVHITRRVLNKRQKTSQWIRYSIVRITGPDDQAINQCNRSLERAVPLYQKRKEYTRRAPVTLYSRNLEARGDFRPKTVDVMFRKKCTSSKWASTGIVSTRNVGLFRGKQSSVTADLNTQIPTSFTSAPLSPTIRTNLNALDDSQSENTADMLSHPLPTPASISSSPTCHSVKHAIEENDQASLGTVHSVNPSKCLNASITSIEPKHASYTKAIGKYNIVRIQGPREDDHLDVSILQRPATFGEVIEAKPTNTEGIGPAWLPSSAELPEIVNVSPTPDLTLMVSDFRGSKDDVSVEGPFIPQVTNLSASLNGRLPLNNLVESFQLGGIPPSGPTTEQATVVTEQKEQHMELSACVANELSTTQEIKLDCMTTGPTDITRKVEHPFEVNETTDMLSSRCDLNDEAVGVSTTTQFCVTTVSGRSDSSFVDAPISEHFKGDRLIDTYDVDCGTDEILRIINNVGNAEHASCSGITARSKSLIVNTPQKQWPCLQHFIWKHSEEAAVIQSLNEVIDVSQPISPAEATRSFRIPNESDNPLSRNELSSQTSVHKSVETPGIRGVAAFDPHTSIPIAVGNPSSDILNPQGRPDFTNRRASPRAPCEPPLSNPRSLAGDDIRSKSPPGAQATRPLSSLTSISSHLGLQVNRETGGLELSFGVSGTPFLAADTRGETPAFDPSFSAQWNVKLERNLLFGPIGRMTSPVPQ